MEGLLREAAQASVFAVRVVIAVAVPNGVNIKLDLWRQDGIFMSFSGL